jgi:hypothetical protein
MAYDGTVHEQGIEVHSPTDDNTTKTADIARLLREGKNICTTHAKAIFDAAHGRAMQGR